MTSPTPPSSPPAADSHVRRSSRPFSPSPARETRHTASRPPSLLFGAPMASSLVATSQSFSLEGLPPTPPARESVYDGLTRRDQVAEQSHASGSMGMSFGQAEGILSSPVDPERRSSMSSTSSASPPLGAASILSALAEAPPHPSTISESSSMPSLTHPSSSGSSELPNGSFHASTSKSMPRLHQPTVIRRTSGRGVAFLPPPVHVSNVTETFAIHQPRPKRYSMPTRPSADILESNLRLRSTSPDEPNGKPRPVSADFEEIRAFFESASAKHLADPRSPRKSDRGRGSNLSPVRDVSRSSATPKPPSPPSSEDERRVLHEVPDRSSTASEVAVWLPPYKPRTPGKAYPGPSKFQDDRLAITLYAGIPPPKHDATPYRMNRLEIALAWGKAERLAWLPLRWVFPVDWQVRVVHGELDPEQKQGLVRVVVKSVVRRVPVVWRLAGWL